MNFERKSLLAPAESERICLISFEVAKIRVGGDPDERPGFWAAYREELELNLKTNFMNQHVLICRNQLRHLADKLEIPFYYRDNRLTTERVIGVEKAPQLPASL